MAYIDPTLLETFAEAPEGTPSVTWQQLADAASDMFDREAEVTRGFFAKASATATVKYFRGAGTEYVRLWPFIAGSIEAVTIDGEAVETGGDDYFEDGFYLVFDYEIEKNALITVTARWGFSEIPADIKQACIEQALFLWRKKDLAFADLANVAASVANAEMSQTFAAVARRYRDLYSQTVFA